MHANGKLRLPRVDSYFFQLPAVTIAGDFSEYTLAEFMFYLQVLLHNWLAETTLKIMQHSKNPLGISTLEKKTCLLADLAKFWAINVS